MPIGEAFVLFDRTTTQLRMPAEFLHVSQLALPIDRRARGTINISDLLQHLTIPALLQ